MKFGEQLLTNAEAAARLGIQPGTLAVWRRRGIGPAYVRRAGAIRPRILYRESDIEAYLRKRTVPEGRSPKPSLFPPRRWWEVQP
jgi:predicted site-specific integrase-resolvase